MEDIKLPLKRGSLNDIEASQASGSQDDMEIDDSSQVSKINSNSQHSTTLETTNEMVGS